MTGKLGPLPDEQDNPEKIPHQLHEGFRKYNKENPEFSIHFKSYPIKFASSF
jgi:hypothetical protein